MNLCFQHWRVYNKNQDDELLYDFLFYKKQADPFHYYLYLISVDIINYVVLINDTITVELQLPDSTLITQHIDFTKVFIILYEYYISCVFLANNTFINNVLICIRKFK